MLITFLTWGLLAGAFAQDRPNVVILFTDDAGYADFSFQGSDSHHTPRIDSIAENGVRFTQGYVSASVCSPSRAGLLTGRYQQRFGHESNLPGAPDEAVPNALRGLPLSEKTIADYLKEEGYATGLIGKWHLGMEDHFHPTQRGFDEFFGMRKGSSPYLQGKDRPIECNYKEVSEEELPYLTDAFGDEAAEFIHRHHAQPFFLFLSFNAPHTPLHAREDYLEEAKEEFKTKKRAINAAMTRSLDENVGKVLDALDSHDLTENTLVFFLNDNGGAMPYNASSNKPLRGAKGTCLEGGIRVPFVFQWPKEIYPGSVEERPVMSLDILPTVMRSVGAPLPDEASIDGVDLIPFLTGGWAYQVMLPHEYMYWRLNWAAAIRAGDWKYVRTPSDEEWLFDLKGDPGETVDLASTHPKVFADLKSKLAVWEASLAQPIWVTADRWREHSLQRYQPGFAQKSSFD
ncbi:MAG: sulfatase [Planctomycetes bacterium]|nr:sulfatase [Planctomycetota bacterium]